MTTLLVLATAGQYWLMGGVGLQTGGTRERAESEPRAARERGQVPPHRPDGYAPKVETGLFDYHGNMTAVSCATCHATRAPDLSNGLGGKTPTEFHQGLVYAHGGMSCLSCHAAGDYDSLKLADGRKLAFPQAQMLCAQCHGPQTRDYLSGSHGGMAGHWDLSRGERVRKTCTDCHDVHAPAFPNLNPVFAPIDEAARQQAEREAKNPKAKRPLYFHE